MDGADLCTPSCVEGSKQHAVISSPFVSSEPDRLGCVVQVCVPSRKSPDADGHHDGPCMYAHERPRTFMCACKAVRIPMRQFAPVFSRSPAGLYNSLLDTMFFSLPSLPWPACTPRVPPGTTNQREWGGGCAGRRASQNNVSQILPTLGDQTCRQRCYFGRRLLDQTKHSGETAEPNKCLPHILGHLCNSPRSWYASPRPD